MIWYLLYAFRGTTEAPVLCPSHPLRRAFTRYGAYAARHVVTTLLISSAVAAILIYPFSFLFTSDFSNGASNLPHHVWTLARPLHRQHVEPDVIMRSIWVHGSYMKALDREVLLGALELQDELLGSTVNFNPRRPPGQPLLHDASTNLTPMDRDSFHVVNGLTNQSWFFHSPLLYWSGSAERIGSDKDIISTVNQRKNQPTSANVTLRHSIVFSGKHFEEKRLLAADALVITLIHLRDSPVGRQWERKAGLLASRMADKWTAYPADGRSMSSELYEFQFRPMSLQDTAILGMAYSLAAVYFLVSMSKLRAVKSKFGLVVTVMSQIVMSIFSSFTICAIFKIDLSRIPQAAYPLVVLSMSLENIFRLINAVIATPSEDSTSSRIGYAFGETAHIALASSAQNVLILWGLSQVVSPGVSAFCTFASVAIVLDFFYLSTFFLSVLSVDVRRTELSDALDTASSKFHHRDGNSVPRPSWVDAVLQGKVAVSTRIAGTIIMIGFVLVAQWHFFENETLFRVLGGLFSIPGSHGASFGQQKESLLVDVHQARSPTSWLRLQDHDTAREVINVVKPWAYSYTAKVYDPLVFVLKGADRTPHSPERPLLPALYDFIDHHLTRFAVTVVFILAALLLLMNYLLWEKEAEAKAPYESEDGPLMSIASLSGGHSLDIAMMAASADGHIISVGLDRSLRLWDVRSSAKEYTLAGISSPPEDPFPVLSVAVDEDCQWLAILSPRSAQIWSRLEQQWMPAIPLELQGQKPQAFFFEPTPTTTVPSLIMVRRNGNLTHLSPASGSGPAADFTICKTPLVSAEPLVHFDGIHAPNASIITASKKGCVHLASLDHGEWTSQSLDLAPHDHGDSSQVLPLSDLDCFLVTRHASVDLVDSHQRRLLHTFSMGPIQPRSLRCFHSARRKPQCGSVGLVSFGLVFNDAHTGDCIIQTYKPKEEGDIICFRNSDVPASRSCCEWLDTKMAERRIGNPGVWEALSNGCVVGVRRDGLGSVARETNCSPDHASSGLRRRARSYQRSERPRNPSDSWEVWMANQSGRQAIYETKPLHSVNEDGGHLMISNLGPMVRVGTASVVVGFGNIIKLITVGQQRFEDHRSIGAGRDLLGVGSRRRRQEKANTARTRLSTWA